jgi:hypothetical protein
LNKTLEIYSARRSVDLYRPMVKYGKMQPRLGIILPLRHIVLNRRGGGVEEEGVEWRERGWSGERGVVFRMKMGRGKKSC